MITDPLNVNPKDLLILLCFQFRFFHLSNTFRQNQNTSSLLVKSKNDIYSPGVVTGEKLVPSSHKRCEIYKAKGGATVY